jgi:hypothetical protein
MKALRPDEQFVMDSLRKALSGTSTVGEDPPDAYFTFDEGTVAVEISTLTQYVEDDSGRSISRWSQDHPALSICDEIDKLIGTQIPQGKRVWLVLESPVLKARKLTPLLAKRILEEIEKRKEPTTEIEENILGNKIVFQVADSGRSSDKKVVGIAVNQRSSANILENARFILAERISAKAKKCASLNFRGPLWLALLNQYWLADAKTYERAMAGLEVSHCFDRILIVSTEGGVSCLYRERWLRFSLWCTEEHLMSEEQAWAIFCDDPVQNPRATK